MKLVFNNFSGKREEGVWGSSLGVHVHTLRIPLGEFGRAAKTVSRQS